MAPQIVRAALLLLILVCQDLFAQDFASKWSAGFSYGPSDFYDPDTDDSGYCIAGLLTYRLSGKTVLGISPSYMKSDLNSEFFFSKKTARLLDVSIYYNFSQTRVQPYVFGGVSFIHSHFRSGFPDDEPEIFEDRKRTEVGFNAGLGLNVFINQRFSLGAEYRFTNAELTYLQTRFQAGYHW